ncbi:MAG TPA: ribbon-helix-helix domain-containing protein [Pseudolabrys sp.]|jgi:predicted DNA-binding ribbon-helix-helix protein|nr:ribbon-helix-helix domain-containing protein [Pseudolabrys sp.]
MKSLIVKRSVVIDGHKTSVCLEDAFWRDLKEIARTQSVSVATLIKGIDQVREGANLSSAIRLFVFDHVRTYGANGATRQDKAPDLAAQELA